MFILDTDICIYLMEGRAPHAFNRLHALTPDDVGTSAITAAELRYGAMHSDRPDANLLRLEDFIGPMMKLPFDDAAATRFGQLKQYLTARGTIIGGMDLLIAATVIATGDTLVTNNVAEFSRVPGLKLENWAQPPP